MGDSLDCFLISQREDLIEENRKIRALLDQYDIPRKRPNGEFYSLLEGIVMLISLFPDPEERSSK